ncbi:hypothetical protein ILYODFUR_028532 [Ilyodon furcidens]|uniref:Uncharacterized protein n=2 Tax=Goodeidae TaxID=28758 RepID=A0ABV0T179_9TELE
MSYTPRTQQQMRVLFVLSNRRRAFRSTTHASSGCNFSACGCAGSSIGAANALDFLSFKPGIRPFLDVSPPGGCSAGGKATEEAGLEDMEAGRPCRGSEL